MKVIINDEDSFIIFFAKLPTKKASENGPNLNSKKSMVMNMMKRR